ncbi:hypothetical protein QBC46DRAFT_398415 [Diplogelasinospora grovesii]|uniref:CENP-V/GFA domain-containing protein n=1 Tax=Diplogelasinospora grovesii TaxID=303347 RepID=A0AAN6MX12_9PEZI|nr:hypothetical protein QBC46DRAFT_398415 [Diplogelasinospora grovesii]
MSSEPSTSTTPVNNASPGPARKPYTGSCHCGAVRYIVYLTLPLQQLNLSDPPSATDPPQVVYRCNCTTCQKTGVLHLRLRSAPDDFALLAPLGPLSELADYSCFAGDLHWLFCRACGVRCFTFMGRGEIVEGVLPGYNTTPAKHPDREHDSDVNRGNEGVMKYWHPVKEGWSEKRSAGSYLSVNALTLDAGQPGIDLPGWTEKKLVMYIDCLEAGDGKKGERTYERPFPGGCY